MQELLNELKRMGITDKILDALKKVDRKNYVLKESINDAYKNYPLSIGYNQTISQPYTVAYMLQLLEIKPNNTILEIGTGSGYNAAIISKLAKKVITLEVISELIKYANDNLEKENIKNVTIYQSNGYYGYEKFAPYDRIIITAACPKIPPPLISQLKKTGIMVLPLKYGYCEKMTKIKNGVITKHGDFSFVPLKI